MVGINEVIIDDRESEEFVGLFESIGAKRVRVERLKVGDFVVDQRWVFERKTMKDLCVSIVDGRLFRQATNMLKSVQHPVVIVQGLMSEAEGYKMSRESISGALVTISVFFNIPVLYAVDAAEVVRLVNFTVMQERRYNKDSVYRYGYRPKRLKTQRLFLLQGLPGIGKKRAQKLLEVFGNVRSIMAADETGLAAVEGIGKILAKRICEILQ